MLAILKGQGQSEFLQCGFDRTDVFDDQVYAKIKEPMKIDFYNRRSWMTIPVVFHIVLTDNSDRITDELIFRQLDYLNQDFQSRNPDQSKVPDYFKSLVGQSTIRFCLASEDSFGNGTIGIERIVTSVEHIGIKNELYSTSKGGSDAWNTDQYLNIWIADTGPNIAGLGSAPGQRNKNEDGVIIHPDLFNSDLPSRTLTHEIGHYLGLFHMWNMDGSCEDNDFVEDTPVQAHPYYHCPQKKRITCNTADMYMNYMDYTDHYCMYFFTKGQIDRMTAILVQFRSGLLKTKSECNLQNPPRSDYIVYPNPMGNGKIWMQFDDGKPAFLNMKIYNIAGKLVFSINIWKERIVEINLGLLDPGIYIINVDGVVKKIISAQ